MRKTAFGFVLACILWTPNAYGKDSLESVAQQSNCRHLRTLAPKENIAINAWLTGSSYRLSGLINDTAQRDIFANSSVTYSFVLMKNGNIEDLRKENSSGNVQVEKRALEIIKKAVPFPVPKANQIIKQRVNVVFANQVTVELGDRISNESMK